MQNSEDDDNDDHTIMEDAVDPTYTQEDVAFAMLTLFFSGKITQTALETCVKLFNILTGKKLPQEFEDLLKIIMKTNSLEGLRLFYLN